MEVDLTKPLPNTISFKGKNGDDVRVSISYPWLPPRCSVCVKWGHVAKNCQAQKQSAFPHSQTEAVGETHPNDYVVLKGFSSRDLPEASGTVIITKLMAELESMSDKDNFLGRGVAADQSIDDIDGVVVEDQRTLAVGQPSDITLLHDSGKQVDCLSPNGFQILQDLREEGEIDSEDEVEEPSNDMGDDDQGSQGIPATIAADTAGCKTAPGPQRGSLIRRGRGSKKIFANSRSLVQAASQQQKGSHHAKKASSRRL